LLEKWQKSRNNVIYNSFQYIYPFVLKGGCDMEIKKNIAAKLKAVMKERELSTEEFSRELGIARSSLQNYLKEEVEIRSDTMELLSEKLHCSLRELIVGTDGVPVQGLEEFVQSLHPALHPFVDLLRQMMCELKRLSDELYAQEAQGGDEET